MKKLLLMIAMLLLVPTTAISQSKPWVPVTLTEYMGVTGKEITVAWEDQPYNTYHATDQGWCPLAMFQIAIYNIERNVYVEIDYDIPRDQFTKTFKIPMAGHWEAIIRVRQKCEEPYRPPDSPSCINHTEPDKQEGYEYSEWCISSDAGCSKVNGTAQGWRIFAWLAPPGPIEFSNDR